MKAWQVEAWGEPSSLKVGEVELPAGGAHLLQRPVHTGTGRGFAPNARDGSVTIFDLKTLKVISEWRMGWSYH